MVRGRPLHLQEDASRCEPYPRTWRPMAVRRETRLWWEQAKRDFGVAQRNHANRDYDVAVFLCEQAVQKALKAVIIHMTDREPPKIRNLVELGRLAGVPKSMGDFMAELSPHYMLTRYPD